MKFIPKLIIVFLAIIGMFWMSSNAVNAVCCVDNCSDGSCCLTAQCPNPDPIPGEGGGGGGSCQWSQVNCPAGWTRSGEAISSACGTRCPPLGTAQANTGCCGEGKVDEEGVWYCGNQRVTTYGCCPANTTPKETLVSGGTYTRDNGCSSSTTCNDGDDLYIGSWGSSTVCSRTCAYPDEERGCRGQEKHIVYSTTYLCREKHLQYSCEATCDANAWGAWGACSGIQNTQTRTNACGTVETKDCPRLAGTVYYDALNNCSGAGWSSGGVAVSLDGGAGSAVSPTVTFTLLASSTSSHSLAVSLPAGYICSTAAGCNTCSRSSIISPSNNNFFYLTNLREAWWQAEGAGVYAGSMAGGVTVRSELPTALTRLILPGAGGTSAALLRASGQTDLGAGTVSTEGWSILTRYQGKRMDYQYFAARMGVIRVVDKL